MILAVDSDLPTFKSVTFTAGLNVLLSDKEPSSGERKTRNSAGKSSLIELLHFICGARAHGSLAGHPSLKDYTFYGTFDFGGKRIQVGRTANEPSKIFLSQEDATTLGIPVKQDSSEKTFISNENWKGILGHLFFGLPFPLKGTVYGGSYTPKFRSLISYFARRRGAFAHPQKNSEEQSGWDSQVSLSYLLGLDWSIPSALEAVRLQEKQLAELKKAAKGGTVGEIIGTVAELRPKIVRLEAIVTALQKNIAEFRVFDAYKEWSDRASQTRSEMLAIEREAVLLKQSLAHVEAALADEQPPQTADLERLYQAVGVELPGTAIKRFDEVREFHLSVIANRRSRLETEAEEIRRRIAAGEARVKSLDDVRSGILRSLAGSGAFEDLVGLQSTLAHREAELSLLRERYQAAGILEGKVTALEIDRANLKLRLQEDHHARQNKLDKAILAVGELIEDLYDDRSGAFVIGAHENGPSFEIEIEGDRGGGISQVEVFCLDVALLLISRGEHGGPRFLVHDSHLFDGVDERQIARAIALGKGAAESIGGQYIVTMNSDVYDRLPFPDSFDAQSVVNPTRLSDAGDDGGLFGFRFD